MTPPCWDGRSWILGGRRMTVAEMTPWWGNATPSLRRRARRLLSRCAAGELRKRAWTLLAADNGKVYFKARGARTRLENERSRMGFELFGRPIRLPPMMKNATREAVPH